MIMSDSTTLIVLFDLQRLELHSNLFEKVFVPKALHQGITVKSEIELPAFMEVPTVTLTKERKIARKKGIEILGLLGVIYLNVKRGF